MTKLPLGSRVPPPSTQPDPPSQHFFHPHFFNKAARFARAAHRGVKSANSFRANSAAREARDSIKKFGVVKSLEGGRG